MTHTIVNIKSGKVRGVNIKNKLFEAHGPVVLKTGKKGTFLTLFNRFSAEFPIQNVRVLVKEGQYEIVNKGDAPIEADVTPAVVTKSPIEKTDDELYETMRIKFNIMNKLIQGCVSGLIKGCTFTGGAGIGKTHNVQRNLEANGYEPIIFEHEGQDKKEDAVSNALASIANDINEPESAKKYYVVVKGRVTPLGLYKTLFEHKDKIILFDDCDSVLQEPISLNLLKAALDSYERRIICYNSRAVGSEGLPRKFEFTGAIVFISNINFDKQSPNSKLRAHVDAIMSRCHYLNLDMNTPREKILRIRQVMKENDLFYRYNDLTEEHKEEIINYIDTNQNRLREISLRTALKLAEILLINSGVNWKGHADECCLLKDYEYGQEAA